MNPFAAGFSIFVSIISALTVIGLPVEVYQHGNGLIWRIAGGLFGTIFMSLSFVPLFHKLKVYSVYRLLPKVSILRIFFWLHTNPFDF